MNPQKKNIELTGSLIYPIEVGEAAFIREADGMRMVHQIAANIANIIEDGYIENRMLNSFPGTLGYGLETLRERHFDEIDTVTELIAKETDDGRHMLC